MHILNQRLGPTRAQLVAESGVACLVAAAPQGYISGGVDQRHVAPREMPVTALKLLQKGQSNAGKGT